jgi:predicted DNA binding protein
VIDAVEDAYPPAELLRRQQVARDDGDVGETGRVIEGDLTDRQRAAIEAAYHAGFFEWPRDASGEELAASFGISPSTFHQHLRTAERKVLDALLSDAPATDR